jgi:hypothetical protein
MHLIGIPKGDPFYSQAGTYEIDELLIGRRFPIEEQNVLAELVEFLLLSSTSL